MTASTTTTSTTKKQQPRHRSARQRRGLSVFDTVHQLETQDAVARTRQKATAGHRQAASQAALSQQGLHSQLVQVRILLQRALVTPAGSTSEDDQQQQAMLDECNQLLAMLLHAQAQLASYGQDEETKSTSLKHFQTLVKDRDNEAELTRTLQANLDRDTATWKQVLNRRHQQVRLHAGRTAHQSQKFRVLDASFWTQVEATLRHEQHQSLHNNTDNDDDSPMEDGKVYQQLLKDFVTAHPQGAEAQRSAQERLSKTQRTVHKAVDRRASKGRKLRYTPMPKLAHFTFPLSRPTAALDDDAWFQSLFGGAAASSQKKVAVSAASSIQG